MESKENKSAAGANDFTNERATNDKGKAVMKDEDDNQDIVDNRNTADNSNTVDKSMQTIVPVPKTLIVCCDGTGNDAVQVEKGDTLDDECRPIESLVALLGDELATTGPVHGLQIVNYIAGPGIGPYRHEKLVGGLIGKGVDQRAQSGYDWICRNWQKSDKICIIGFSRGAYIARLIQLMVTCLGALTVKGRRVLPIIVDQYWSIGFPGEYKPKGDELIFSSHEATREALKNLATYKSALISEGLAEQFPVRVEILAVIDTVAAMGLGHVRLNPFDHQIAHNHHLCMLQPKGCNQVLHILALEEKRHIFTPTMFEPNNRFATNALGYDSSNEPGVLPDRTQLAEADADEACCLRQVWFPGCHTDVAGGNPDDGIAMSVMPMIMDTFEASNFVFKGETLDRMLARVKTHTHGKKLVLDVSTIRKAKNEQTQQAYTEQHPYTGGSQWGAAPSHNSSKSALFRPLKNTLRTPGLHIRHELDAEGKKSQEIVTMDKIGEEIHRSVRLRYQQDKLHDMINPSQTRFRGFTALMKQHYEPELVPSSEHPPNPHNNVVYGEGSVDTVGEKVWGWVRQEASDGGKWPGDDRAKQNEQYTNPTAVKEEDDYYNSKTLTQKALKTLQKQEKKAKKKMGASGGATRSSRSLPTDA